MKSLNKVNEMKKAELQSIISEEIRNVLSEKAKSQSQQQAAGIALAVKKGKAPKSALKGASKSMYKMSTKELEKFAKTKHKGLPVKKNEAVMQEGDPYRGIKSDIGETWENNKTIESDIFKFLENAYESGGPDTVKDNMNAINSAMNKARKFLK